MIETLAEENLHCAGEGAETSFGEIVGRSSSLRTALEQAKRVATTDTTVNKQVESIRRVDLNALVSYSWPGNVRELQNVMERSVILSSHGLLQLAPLKPVDSGTPHECPTLAAAERDHILHVLRQTNWVIGGLHGAAALLGLKRTTLLKKMRRLGISRPRE